MRTDKHVLTLSRVLDATTLIALATAFTYLLGLFSEGAYLYYFGLPLSLFLAAPEILLTQGFLVLFNNAYVVVPGLLFILFAAAAHRWLKGARRIGKAYASVVARLLRAVALAAALLLALVWAFEAAAEFGKSRALGFVADESPSSQALVKVRSQAPLRGRIVLSSESHLALLVSNGASPFVPRKMVVVPYSEIVQMELTAYEQP